MKIKINVKAKFAKQFILLIEKINFYFLNVYQRIQTENIINNTQIERVFL